MTTSNPILELTTAVNLGRKLAANSRDVLLAATPSLVEAIRHRSGQSVKVERILWSLWNDEHPISLCEALSGLDASLAAAVIALISARAHMGGDADGLVRDIIVKSGSKPPTTTAP